MYTRGWLLIGRAPVEVLTSLFETLDFASLQREESQPIICRIAFLDRTGPDLDSSEWKIANRWQVFHLAADLPLKVRNLVKLSAAVDPWGSTLAVDGRAKGNLRIWGLIDQSVHYSRFVVKEAASGPGPEMPGMFHAVIEGSGELSVYKA